MNGFQGFSEAAKLYTENYEVVQEVRAAYERDADALVAALEARIKALVAPTVLSTYTTKSNYTYWWLGRRNRDRAVTLWFEARDPSHIDHESILLYVEATCISGDAAVRLRQLAGADLGFDEPQSNSYYALNLEVSFEGDDPLAGAAERIAKALRAIAEFNPR